MLENALIFVKVFGIFWNIYRYFLSSRCRTFISQYSKQFYKAKLYIAMIAILKRPNDSEWCMAKSVCEEVLVKCRASYGLNPHTIKTIKHFKGDYFSCFFLMHVFLTVAILSLFP